ncbi:MAG: hypothetical protein ABIH23_24475, partial [bacterium]
QLVSIEIDEFYRTMAQLLPKPILPLTGYSHFLKFINRWLLHAHPNWHELHTQLTRYFCRDIFEQIGWQHCQDAFLTLQKLCADNNILLLTAIYPTMYRLYSLEDHPFTSHYERIREFASENNILCIQPLDDYIGKSVDAMRAYVDDPHPSGKSHRIFAQRLHREMKNHWKQYQVSADWENN